MPRPTGARYTYGRSATRHIRHWRRNTTSTTTQAGGPAIVNGHANSARSTLLVRPLNRRTTSAGEPVRRTLTKTCTWSGITSLAAISSKSSSRRIAIRPLSSRYRYFGHQTRCNPSDDTPPVLRRKRDSPMQHRFSTRLRHYETDRVCVRVPIHLTAKAASPLGTC